MSSDGKKCEVNRNFATNITSCIQQLALNLCPKRLFYNIIVHLFFRKGTIILIVAEITMIPFAISMLSIKLNYFAFGKVKKLNNLNFQKKLLRSIISLIKI
jgi:hypothetical protein